MPTTAPSWAADFGTDAISPFPWAEVDCGVGVRMRLRWIPPGTFLMGSPEDEPGRDAEYEAQHPVTLTRGFWLGATTVTVNQWLYATGHQPVTYRHAGDLPVCYMTWDACQKYCQVLAERHPGLMACLPTEAQWEYACRAGTTTPYSFGATITRQNVNHDDGEDRRQRMVPVASLPPNPWGLYEMHGNVSEWCQDCAQTYTAAPATDPVSQGGTALGGLRMLRGGSLYDDAQGVRSACRGILMPCTRAVNVGFRVCAV